MVLVARTAARLGEALGGAGGAVGLVPTMGALHDGHLALVRRARRECGVVVASLFINPTQFGAGEDFERYPRDEERDLRLFGENGVDIVYAPTVAEMYPEGPAVSIAASELAQGLCGAVRPGHFDGVATVVARLLAHCAPDQAYFGEKDYQQLKVIERLAADLDLGVGIVGVPTVREEDGLALSSRNAYLDAERRRIAPALYAALRTIAEGLGPGSEPTALCRQGERMLLDAGFDRVDYFEIRDSETLAPAARWRRGLRVFAAAWLGSTRLIDNALAARPEEGAIPG